MDKTRASGELGTSEPKPAKQSCRQKRPDYLRGDEGGNPSIDGPVTIELPIIFKRHGGRKYITSPDGKEIVSPKTPKFDNSLIRAVVRGHEFLEKFDQDPNVTILTLKETEKLDHAYIAKTIRMTQLAPDIIEAILNGRQPRSLTLSQMLRPFPDSWTEQRKHFGFGISL